MTGKWDEIFQWIFAAVVAIGTVAAFAMVIALIFQK